MSGQGYVTATYIIIAIVSDDQTFLPINSTVIAKSPNQTTIPTSFSDYLPIYLKVRNTVHCTLPRYFVYIIQSSKILLGSVR